jgi:hypothetical protein
MGAPVGNSNAASAHAWKAAIERAIAKRSRLAQKEALDELAEKLLERCDEGDMGALKELGDRLDGRPHQTVAADLSGEIKFAIVSYAEIKP